MMWKEDEIAAALEGTFVEMCENGTFRKRYVDSDFDPSMPLRGRPVTWLEDDDKRLLALHDSGMGASECGRAMGRNPHSTQQRLRRLLAKRRKSDIGNTPLPPGPVARVIRAVAKATGNTPEAIKGRSRNKETVKARHLAIALSRELTQKSTLELGRIFSRDHSTICYVCDEVKAKREKFEPHYSQAKAIWEGGQ